MRQLHVKVPSESVERVLALASREEAFAALAVDALGADGRPHGLIYLDLPNDRLGAFVDAVNARVPEAEFILLPEGALHAELPGRAPRDEAYWRVADRSTLELVMGAMHSVSSWKGLVVYALAAGVFAAYGLIFGVQYLLVAAMLIAPLGSPAVVAVVGTAIGDWRLVLRGAARFAAATAVILGASAGIGYAYGLRTSTFTIDQVTHLSVLTVVVALVAGIAGGQAQVQPVQSSMVAESVAGFLIAAALAPPASVAGLSLVTRRWDQMTVGCFIVGLQYVAIQLGGWISLRASGVRPRAPAALRRGSRRWRNGLVAGATLSLIGLTGWQLRRSPLFLRADIVRTAAALARDKVATVPGVRVIDVIVRLEPGAGRPEGKAVVLRVAVRMTSDSAAEPGVAAVVRTLVAESISARWPTMIPFVDVQVTPGPGGEEAPSSGPSPSASLHGPLPAARRL